MFTIQFNGQSTELAQSMSITEFLQQQQIELGCSAIALNRQFIPKSHYADRQLKQDDCLECVTPMQGG